ncbi:hypothetical protein MPLDJ20_190106 [Mesorhizobium plurifarium]|uniref:Uncharacterized protein n=1 Tax=Mesorhizobium plurifarium TaxID=69974 RepID=A0A090ET37_MESPL|nr:hypothetical protein MPLDJ20_190106 [Mesorhizobium plurifarium]
MPEPTLPTVPSSLDATRSRLEQAAQYLARVTEPGKAVFHTLAGVREILFAACESADLASEFPALLPKLSQLTAGACPILANDGAMSPERVYWGLGRTNDLLTPLAPSIRTARISHVAIFVAELTIAFHRRQLMLAGHEIFEAFLERSAAPDFVAPPTAVH